MGNTLWALLVSGRIDSFPSLYLVLCRWDNQKGAENICKQLGYAGGTHYAAPGGIGPINAGNRLCSGGEATVWDCPLMNSLPCSHDHDQGVSCTDPVPHKGKFIRMTQKPTTINI